MEPSVRRPTDDDQIWEHRLFPLLLMAFGIAAGATLASATTHAPAYHYAAAEHGAIRTATLPTPARAPKSDLAEVRIADVVVNDGESTSVVLLVDHDADTVIPIFVDTSEGQTIREQLRSSRASTGLAGLKSFLAQTIDALGGTIERIEVQPHAEERYASQVVLRHGDSQVALDAKLPDALALAAATGTPLFVDHAMLSDEGIHREAIKHRPVGFPSSIHKPESL